MTNPQNQNYVQTARGDVRTRSLIISFNSPTLLGCFPAIHLRSVVNSLNGVCVYSCLYKARSVNKKGRFVYVQS